MSAVPLGLRQLPCFQAPQGGGSGFPALDPCIRGLGSLRPMRRKGVQWLKV